jgi:hypothetical protein
VLRALEAPPGRQRRSPGETTSGRSQGAAVICCVLGRCFWGSQPKARRNRAFSDVSVLAFGLGLGSLAFEAMAAGFGGIGALRTAGLS